MKPSTVFWMGIATLALVISAWAAHSTRARVARIEKGPLFPGLMERANDVAEIEIETGEGAFRVVREDDRWILPAKGGYQARPERTRELVQSLAELQIIEPKTSNPNLFSHLGLVDPSDPDGGAMRITLRDEEGGTLASLHRGGYLENDVFTRWFARRDGEAQAWYVEGNMPRVSNPLDWIHRQIVQTPASRLTEVEIQRANGERLVAVRTAPDGGDPDEDAAAWRLRGAPASGGDQVDNLAFAIATAAAYIGLDDVTRAAEIPWPSQGVTVMRYRTSSGLTVEARLAEIAGESWVRVSASGGKAPSGEASPMENGAASSADARAAEINQRVSGFAFKVNETEARGIRGEPATPGAGESPAGDDIMLPQTPRGPG